MKKLYTIIGALFITGLSTFAQPVLNESDLTNGLSFESYEVEDITGLKPGNAGPNQVWDFSSLPSPTKIGTFGSIPVSTAPFHEKFTTANYCFKWTDDASTDYDGFTIMTKTSTSLTIIGDTDADNYYIYMDPITLLKFPYTYGTVINDTYQYAEDEPVYASTSTYDAYGTLKTPFGTYFNVIRQKTIDDDGYTSYSWFKTNPFSIIMDGAFLDSNDFGYVNIYKVASELSVNKNTLENPITVYPNPSKSIINLQLPKGAVIDKVVITDLTGKTIYQNDQGTGQINIQNLANGMYVIQAFNGEKKFQSKFIKE